MFNKPKTEKKQTLTRSQTEAAHQWKWFFGLYVLGFISLTGIAYLLKGIVSFL